MLQLKNIILLSLITSLTLVSRVSAGLYGFTEAHPYTYEEELLDMDTPPLHIPNYRGEMRNNLLMLIDYAKSQNPQFKIIAHEGEELLNKSLWEYHLDGYNEARKKGINANDPAFLTFLNKQKPESFPSVGTPAQQYMSSLDAIAINHLYCNSQPLSKLIKKSGLPIIALEQCPDEESFDVAIIDSIVDQHLLYGFTNADLAFKDLIHMPVINESAENIRTVKDAHNIVLLTDDSTYADKFAFIEALRGSNYDIAIINPLFRRNQAYTKEEIRSMQFKKNGTRRLLIAEMNVSEADGRDYYWNRNWKIGKPDWLTRLSFVNENSIITKYWERDWQQIMAKHFKGIVDSGYDGVFFTGLENHQYFEKQTPLE